MDENIPAIYRYRYIHDGEYAENACGMVAFYYMERMQVSDTLKVGKALLVNGKKPIVNTDAFCGSCGKSIRLGDRSLSIEDRRDDL